MPATATAMAGTAAGNRPAVPRLTSSWRTSPRAQAPPGGMAEGCRGCRTASTGRRHGRGSRAGRQRRRLPGQRSARQRPGRGGREHRAQRAGPGLPAGPRPVGPGLSARPVLGVEPGGRRGPRWPRGSRGVARRDVGRARVCRRPLRCSPPPISPPPIRPTPISPPPIRPLPRRAPRPGQRRAARRLAAATPAAARGRAPTAGPGRQLARPASAPGGRPERGTRGAARGRRGRKAARARRARILLAAGLAVVIAAAAGTYFYLSASQRQPGQPAAAAGAVPSAQPGRPSASPSPTPAGRWGHIQTRLTDPQKLTLHQLFPVRFTSSGSAYTRTAAKAGKHCTPAVLEGSRLQSAVSKADCSQVMRRVTCPAAAS